MRPRRHKMTNGPVQPYKVAAAITQALDPARAPGKLRTFAQMTPTEQAEMRRLYEQPIRKK